jgi:hypothetical protein
VAIWQAAPYEDWVKESFCLRQAVYDFGTEAPANAGELPGLGYAYAFHKLPIVRERLLTAGVRLAGRLNAVFAGLPAPAPAPVPTAHTEWCR